MNTGLSPFPSHSNGTVKWAAALPGNPASYGLDTSPAIGGDGVVFAGSSSEHVIGAFDGNTGGLLWTVTGVKIGHPTLGPNGVLFTAAEKYDIHAFDSGTGSGLWEVTENGWASPVALSESGLLYVSSYDGPRSGVYPLCAYIQSSGVLAWSYDAPTDELRGGPAVGPDGSVYVGSMDQNVYAVTATGQKKWTQNTGGKIEGSPVVAPNGLLYIGNDQGTFLALSTATGAPAWSFQCGGPVQGSGAVDNAGSVFFGSFDQHVYALAQSSGVLKWKFLTNGAVQSSPAVSSNGVVFIGSNDNNVYALDSSTGALVWKHATNGYVVSSPAIGFNGVVYVASLDGYLYALS